MINPLNMMFNPFKKGRSRAAFQGDMHCPFCSRHVDPGTSPIGFETDKPKIRLTGNIGPLMRGYKCMSCGGEWRYDINARQTEPYSSFKKGLKLPGLDYSGRVPLLKKR